MERRHPKGLIQRFQESELAIELSVEYLDSRRFNKPALQDKQTDILLTKYSGYRFDLVVVSDNAAFQFAVGNRGLLFAGVPIVFCGYNNFRPEILQGFSDITGVLGGRILSGFDQGQAAVEMALQILNGKSADSIPVIMASPTRNIFDYNVMKRFKIAMDALPENSSVINKPYSYYEAHKSAVAIILAVFTALVAFIIVLSLNILKRIRAEKELQQHRDQLERLVQERTTELSETNRALIDSEERFRCLSDASLEGIVFSEKGAIIEVNKACCEMFGYLQVINKTAIDFIAPEERERNHHRYIYGCGEIHGSFSGSESRRGLSGRHWPVGQTHPYPKSG